VVYDGVAIALRPRIFGFDRHVPKTIEIDDADWRELSDSTRSRCDRKRHLQRNQEAHHSRHRCASLAVLLRFNNLVIA
jgi:hypothetical protein